jgi:hypothetical protein
VMAFRKGIVGEAQALIHRRQARTKVTQETAS